MECTEQHLDDVLRTHASAAPRRRVRRTAVWWQERLERIAATAVPGVAHCGVTMRTGVGGLITCAASGPVAEWLDRVQVEWREGPCLDGPWPHGGDVLQIDDLAGHPRWPRFAELASSTGVVSLFSRCLPVDGAVPGAVTFYSAWPGAFRDRRRRAVVTALATHATHVVAGGGHPLPTTPDDVLGRAIAVLGGRFAVDEAGGLDLLAHAGEDTGLSVVDIARRLVDAEHDA